MKNDTMKNLSNDELSELCKNALNDELPAVCEEMIRRNRKSVNDIWKELLKLATDARNKYSK